MGFVGEESEEEADGVGCDSYEGVGLVVDGELFGHVEEFVGFEEYVLRF